MFPIVPNVMGLILGPALLIGWLIIYSRTHQQEIKKELRSGQKNVPYSQKLARNYTPKERRWALVTGLVALGLAVGCGFLFFTGHRLLAGFGVVCIPAIALTLARLGDTMTK